MVFVNVETNLGCSSIDLIAKGMVHAANTIKLAVTTVVDGAQLYAHPGDSWTLVASDFKLHKSNAPADRQAKAGERDGL